MSPFSVAPDVIVPMDVILRQLPGEAEALVPQLRGYSYLAVEEQACSDEQNAFRACHCSRMLMPPSFCEIERLHEGLTAFPSASSSGGLV
jgi:hypothetical protein